ncbi:lamin-B2-like isoform X2 [Tripterygium wilfordii]|uniref:lamin-B2-like isoform X2 n=1 Tax=Tripterygium wilfordii TaxID=458696 RepID=UPI0018F80FA1|nr:lamin-B2-like isoform X2 [Tripterygium wilfordii]
MSSSSRSDGENPFDVEELLKIGARCGELRKEKDLLRESQAQSIDLIRRLELHVKSLSDARTEDKKQIQKLERELMNCSQEIDYLQDQLNARNLELNCLNEHSNNLELKLAGMEISQVHQLTEELMRSESECLLLVQELRNKELELENSASCIEKLEESISSAVLESQCEIESMKLDMMALQQTCFEAKKFQEKTFQEKDRMNRLIKDLEDQLQDAGDLIESLRRENKELRDRIALSEMNGRVFCQKIDKRPKDEETQHSNTLHSELESKLVISEEMNCKDVFGSLISESAAMLNPDAKWKEEMESKSHQIHEYELLVKQLKEELKEEKLKAKEEAEDLAQEMAELRYQLTGLLEEECKRRACIEQASLQRIAELEVQIQGQGKSLSLVRCLPEA